MNTLVVFGGTFDPFHLGHLYLARQAAADFDCRVHLIPNGYPPHRPLPRAGWQQRLSMCRLATAADDAISVGEEETPAQPRYTADTLATLKQRLPQTTLLLLIGGDAADTFPRWHQPNKILQRANLLVAPRSAAAAVPPNAVPLGEKTALTGDCGGTYLWRCQPPPVTAADCRRAAAADDTAALAQLLPAAVIDYIRQRRLYRAAVAG